MSDSRRNTDLLDGLDWRATGLGTPETWPEEMRTLVRVVMATEFPVCTAWGPAGIQIYNEAYNPIYGDKHPRSFGQPVRESWPEIWPFLGPALDQLRATGRPLWFQDTMLPLARHGDPEECWFDFCYSAVSDATGRYLGVMSIATDKTSAVVGARRQACISQALADFGERGEIALSESLPKALAANEMDVHAAALFDVDVHTGLPGTARWAVRASQASVQLLRQSLVQTPGALRTVTGVPYQDPALGSLAADGAVAIPVLGPLGKTEAVLMLVSSRLVPRHSHLLFCRALADHLSRMDRIVRLRSAEIGAVREQLHERDELYRFLFEHIADGAFYAATDGRPGGEEVVLAANPAACRMFGYEEHEIVGKQREEFFFPGDPSLTQAVTERQSEGVFAGELTFRAKDGRRVPVELTSRLVAMSGGQTRSVTIARDISARLQRDQERAERARYEVQARLTGGIAHDFNNLLSVIINSLELLGERLPMDEKLRRPLISALACAERGASLTGQLLAYSRHSVHTARRVQLDQWLVENRDLIQSSIGQINRLVLENAGPLPPCWLDASQLTTALLNLAVNARDAMPEGGVLTIRTEAVAAADGGAGSVLLQVRDTGMGIEPELQAHVFEPYVTTKALGEGSGLGLAMVQGFVRQAGGDIEIASEPGRGTCFTLAFPAYSGPIVLADEGAEDAHGEPAGQCVLVVDDNELLRSQVVSLLDGAGFRAMQARDGRDALAQLAAGAAVDVVLTDMVMPGGMSGLQLAREIERRRPGIPLLMMTGHDPGLQAASAPGRRFEILGKPFTREDIVSALMRALDRRSETWGADAG